MLDEYKRLIKKGYMRKATTVEYAEWLVGYLLNGGEFEIGTGPNDNHHRYSYYAAKGEYHFSDKNIFVANKSFNIGDDKKKLNIIIPKDSDITISGNYRNTFFMDSFYMSNKEPIPLSKNIINTIKKNKLLNNKTIEALNSFYNAATKFNNYSTYSILLQDQEHDKIKNKQSLKTEVRKTEEFLNEVIKTNKHDETLTNMFNDLEKLEAKSKQLGVKISSLVEEKSHIDKYKENLKTKIKNREEFLNG